MRRNLPSLHTHLILAVFLEHLDRIGSDVRGLKDQSAEQTGRKPTITISSCAKQVKQDMVITSQETSCIIRHISTD